MLTLVNLRHRDEEPGLGPGWWNPRLDLGLHPSWKRDDSVEILMMYRFERCHKSMARVPSCNNSDEIRWWCPTMMTNDDDRDRRIPSLLRGSVEDCVTSKDILVVLLLNYCYTSFGGCYWCTWSCKSLERINVNLSL